MAESGAQKTKTEAKPSEAVGSLQAAQITNGCNRKNNNIKVNVYTSVEYKACLIPPETLIKEKYIEIFYIYHWFILFITISQF